VRVLRDRNSGDWKVLDRAQRLNTEIVLGRYIAFAEEILFKAGGSRVTPQRIRNRSVHGANLYSPSGHRELAHQAEPAAVKRIEEDGRRHRYCRADHAAHRSQFIIKARPLEESGKVAGAVQHGQ
jgi:hypothetical protein